MNRANHRLCSDEETHCRPEECSIYNVSPFSCSLGLSYRVVTALLAVCLSPSGGGNSPVPHRTRTEYRPQTNSYAAWMECGLLPAVKELNIFTNIIGEDEDGLVLHVRKEAKAHFGLIFEFFAFYIHFCHTHLKSLAMRCSAQQIQPLLFIVHSWWALY